MNFVTFLMLKMNAILNEMNIFCRYDFYIYNNKNLSVIILVLINYYVFVTRGNENFRISNLNIILNKREF